MRYTSSKQHPVYIQNIRSFTTVSLSKDDFPWACCHTIELNVEIRPFPLYLTHNRGQVPLCLLITGRLTRNHSNKKRADLRKKE